MATPTPDCSLSGQPPYDCEGCDLSNRNLAGKDLTGANLRNTTLTGTVFAGVTSLATADLTGARLGGGTDFSRCDLTATIFGHDPDLAGQPSSPTKLVGATIPATVLGTTWRYLDLTDCTITGLPTDLTWLEITQCTLGKFDFAGRVMKNAHLSGVALAGADFGKATLTNIVFQQGDDGGVCDLTGASFVGAVVTEGVLDTSTLTRADFTGATLTGVSLRQARMDGTIFDGTDLSTARFSSPPRFSSDPSSLTSFRGATLNLSTIGKQWSYLDLTGTTLIGLSSAVDLTYLQAQGAILTGRDLSHFILAQANLSGATLTGAHFSHAKMESAQLYGVQNSSQRFMITTTSADYPPLLAALTVDDVTAMTPIFARHGVTLTPGKTTASTDAPKRWWTVIDSAAPATYVITAVSAPSQPSGLAVLDQSLVTAFDSAQLPGANFSPLQHQRTSLRGADFSGAFLDRADLSLADVSQLNPYRPSTAARFTAASMNHVGPSQADLTGADLTGTVYLHGADLSMSVLGGVDLTGAQLGGLSELFRLPSTTPDFITLLTALRAENVGSVAGVFAAHQQPIAPSQSSIATVVPGRSWTVTDSHAQRTYTILDWTANDGSQFLIVSTPTAAATLTGAYLAGATLINTNLYGVSAAHVQLYGPTVHLDGAILDGAKLAYANLGGSCIEVKSLYDVDLSDANLVNTTLTGADLSQGVSLAYANLQGATFTDTSLNTADLSNAAVSVPLDSSTAGVFLFAVSPSDPRHGDVLAELRAAIDQIDLTGGMTPAQIQGYVADLRRGDLGPLRPLYQQNGVVLSPQASVVATTDASAWQVLDTAGTGAYTVWYGFDDLGDETLLTRPSLPEMQQVFARYPAVAGTLRWQASISSGTIAQSWLLDNDSTNPNNLQLGYATQWIQQESDQTLSFYGTTLRISQLGPGNQLQIRIFSYPPTVLCPIQSGVQQCRVDGSASRFGPDTVCPDGRTLAQNQNSVPPVPWPKMLRAVPPPAPPVCVPSPYGSCPVPSATSMATAEARP